MEIFFFGQILVDFFWNILAEMSYLISFCLQQLNVWKNQRKCLRGCSQMTSSPEGEGGGKRKDDK